MARNHEKGRSMLHQWARLKSGFDSDNRRRPGHTKMCDNLSDAEKWRRDVIKEISKYTSEISNPDLADDMSKVRELNDRINKLLRTKWFWEKRIIELGGVDYIRASNARHRGRGHMYFGVAKQLPEAKANNVSNDDSSAAKPSRSLKVLKQRLTDDYYGIGHENQRMLSEEAAAEKKMRAKILIDQGKHGNDNHRGHLLTKNELEILCSDTIFENAISQQEISKLILDQKKANLLQQYM